MDSSPGKRRVLGSIDVNARSPTAASKYQEFKPKALSPTTNLVNNNAIKRPLEQEAVKRNQEHPPTPPTKKQRLSIGEEEAERMPIDEEGRAERDVPRDEDAENQRSESPEEESSPIDDSAIDITQETVITEPDAEVATIALPTPPAPTRRRSTMTREEARQKAETLRLRLGLASYKVRTGQTDVSLEQLEAKSLLPKSTRHKEPVLPLLPRSTPTQGKDDRGREDGADKTPPSERKTLPTAPPPSRGGSFDKGHSGTGKKKIFEPPVLQPKSR
ncbi:hypothetical protein F5Y11DRAFT_330781 [Daldinia sp. FL1419]|nr:hypothetical protein F5Y11DRAFT_330781 [Daldinia sp. FL1419]